MASSASWSGSEGRIPGIGEPTVELAEATAGDDRHHGVVGGGAGLVPVHPVAQELADHPAGLRDAEEQRPLHALVLSQPRCDVP